MVCNEHKKPDIFQVRMRFDIKVVTDIESKNGINIRKEGQVSYSLLVVVARRIARTCDDQRNDESVQSNSSAEAQNRDLTNVNFCCIAFFCDF